MLSGAVFLSVLSSLSAQQVDLEHTKELLSKKNLLKIRGGFSANSVLYTGNESYARDPFAYYLSGNVSLNFLSLLDVPFTFNLTNSGSNYTYPTMPNRLAFHPTYKCVVAHIGDVSMNFSPYTLNGHLFSGAGVEVNPEQIPLKISAMYGRLQRAVEYGNGNSNAPVAYERMGYGANIRLEKMKYQLGMSFLEAKDDENSLAWKPDSLLIFPQENKAVSWEVRIQLIRNLQLTAEYGWSLLDRDRRISEAQLPDESYHALRTLLNYTFGSNTVGMGYERIDPGYKTLGAYYFNNDLENVTLNYACSLLKNKATLALSGGVQRDDLDNEKESRTRRFVSSANINYTPYDRLHLGLSYSGFQSYMNIKSQFDYINELSPYDNLDTLNYTQLSQNIQMRAGYTLNRSKTRIHNLNLDLSVQEAVDKQGDIIPEGGLSRFYNASLGYGLQFIPQQINCNFNLNITASRMGGMDMLIIGPTMALSAHLFDKKLASGFSASYNTQFSNQINQGEVWNLRWNAGYTLFKKHNVNLSSIYRSNCLKNTTNPSRTNGLTMTLTYNYRF